MSVVSDRIDRLRKRANHLRERIAANPERNLSFDRAELSALDWAVSHLTLCKGVVDMPDDRPDDIGNRRGGYAGTDQG